MAVSGPVLELNQLNMPCFKTEPQFCTWIRQNIPDWEDCVVVSPDEGGAKRSVSIANDLGLEFAMIHNRLKTSATGGRLVLKNV